jgi:exopolysaccharide biosynthesis polyprenyl glycosylphosphotransferase
MIYRIRQNIVKFIYIFIDLVCIVSIFWLVCASRSNTLPFDVNFINLFFHSSNPYRYIFCFWILSTIVLNNSSGLYQTRREVYESFEIWQVIKTTILSSLITIVIIYLSRVEDFPRSIVLIATPLTAISFSLWRLAKRVVVEYMVSNGYNNFNVLIIGAGKVGISLAHEIKKRPGLGLRIIGYLDDFKDKPVHVKEDLKILGKIHEFEQIARREFIHEVFITIHHDSKVFLQLLESAKDLGIAIRVIPQGFELMSGDFRKYNIGFIPILEYYEFFESSRHAIKRIFDFLVTLGVLVLIWPVFLVIAILIKIDSPGPVFYFSKRYGRRGRIFNMFKFRSMVSNADKIMEQLKNKNEVDGPIFKIKEDPRITRVGKFLRKYSLDELPQFINVILGNMSLVGPRPLPIHQVQKEDLRQLRRLEIRPGITGLWQIRGRSDVSFARLLRWDVWYINNWSFVLDLKILLQTFPVVLKGKGAY